MNDDEQMDQITAIAFAEYNMEQFAVVSMEDRNVGAIDNGRSDGWLDCHFRVQSTRRRDIP